MYLPQKRTLYANVLIGFSIALFVWFLKESGVMQFLLAHAVGLLAQFHTVLALARLYHSVSGLSLCLDTASVVLAAVAWTYLRPAKRLVAVASLGLLLSPVAVVLYQRDGVIMTAPLIAFGIAGAIAVDAAAVMVSRRFDSRIADEKHAAEFNILGHLTHNVKPNLQIARSPLLVLRDHLEAKGMGEEVLARRMDGSEETVAEALQLALSGLNRIGEILEHTRKLVTHEIPREEFAEVRLAGLLASEVAPLYAGRLRVSVDGDHQLALSVHRPTFVEAMHNLLRNALTHAFPGGGRDAEVRFALRETRSRVIVDYTNNGKPFPENMSAGDFLTCGRKSHESPGDGLGGAFIGKMVSAHHGSFEVIRDHHPLHFRFTFPKRGT